MSTETISFRSIAKNEREHGVRIELANVMESFADSFDQQARQLATAREALREIEKKGLEKLDCWSATRARKALEKMK